MKSIFNNNEVSKTCIINSVEQPFDFCSFDYGAYPHLQESGKIRHLGYGQIKTVNGIQQDSPRKYHFWAKTSLFHRN